MRDTGNKEAFRRGDGLLVVVTAAQVQQRSEAPVRAIHALDEPERKLCIDSLHSCRPGCTIACKSIKTPIPPCEEGGIT